MMQSVKNTMSNITRLVNVQSVSYFISKIKGMRHTIPNTIKEICLELVELVRVKIIRPIEKRQRRKAYFKRQALVREATGELIDKFEPLLMQLIDQTLSDYHESMPQNFHTIQARHDIRRIYEIKLKSLITSQK